MNEGIYDLVIGVYACDTVEKYKKQILKMNETYVKLIDEHKNMKLIYFLGEEVTDLVGDKYVHLDNVKNDYLSASYKQFLGLKYIYDKYATKMVMFIGTDTYLNVKKLNEFIAQFDEREPLYIGGHGDVRRIGDENIYFHSGGPGFIISQCCLKRIYDYLEHFMDEWIALCNKYKLSHLTCACDVGIAYLVHKKVSGLKTIDIPGLVFSHCNYLGFPCHPHAHDYNKLISCHNMSLNDFDKFTAILTKQRYFQK